MEVMGDENPQSIPKILDRIPRYPYPICSVYGIFTYIWVIFRANLYVNIPYMEHMDNIGSSMTQYKLDLTISIISNSYRGPSTGMRSGGITNDNQTLPSGNQTGQWKIYYSYLVGGFNPSQKYQSIGMIIPAISKNSNMFQTTNIINLTGRHCRHILPAHPSVQASKSRSVPIPPLLASVAIISPPKPCMIRAHSYEILGPATNKSNGHHKHTP